jgi:hypothetical protein
MTNAPKAKTISTRKMAMVCFLTCSTVVLLVASGCRKTVPYSHPLTDYFQPLQVGKYVTYRLDSSTFYFYGQLDTLTSYLAKDSVEEKFTDNTGQTAWRITRYLTDTNAVTPWTPFETIIVNPSLTRIEMVEDNLRFIKLVFPLEPGNTWQGNGYVGFDPYQDFFQYSADINQNMNAWTYTYQSTDQPFTIGKQSFDSAAVVVQVDDSSHVPIIPKDSVFASRTYWMEVYAKHIGMVYRHTEMWEYQPPTPDGAQSAYKIGFKLTMRMVDHN